MDNLRIVGILIKDRIKEAGKTQTILSEYGDIIRSRMGYHEVSEAVCSRIGLLILTLQGEEEAQKTMIEALTHIGGIEVKEMTFPI
ncbi:MAG: hypothetical protein CSA95_07410 [Bacteroidetes bacterium]|nr:MAG: hypothetical protein CSA95_07410 [Bacteroidota bacterium]PIE88660.1 MAG: hypothetical protein CSA04_00720 [Bacteroidota bacterium]